jgi:amino acid adenylation domain-containing protein
MIRDDINTMSVAEKRLLLAQLLRKPQVTPVRSPLSENQKSLLSLQLRSPQSNDYNTAFRIRIHGPVDRMVLQQSLDTILDRHSVLRATYHIDGEGSWLTEHPSVDCELRVVEEADDTARLEQLASAVTAEPFDLETGPILRAVLFLQPTGEHLLLIVVHHIAFDYWSSAVLLREIATVYQDLSTGRPPSLTSLGAQYKDFAEWQTKLLRGDESEKLWQYWLQRLEGELPILDLTTDWPRSQDRPAVGREHRFPLDARVVRHLEQIAREANTTLFTVMLAAFAILLHRYTGQDDIVIGSPAAGRNSYLFEDLIGYFVNPVALRFDLSGDPLLRTFLAATAESVVGAIEHSDLPFVRLVDRLKVVRHPGRSPLFDVMFSWDKAHRRTEQESTPRFELVEARQLGGSQDLTVVVFEKANGLTVSFQYNSALFSAETIERMSGQYAALLMSIAENPADRIGELDLLSPAERDQILQATNHIETPYPSKARIQELFEAQACKSPHALAVVFEGRQITYEELNSRANQLAHHLVGRGVLPGSLVGVYLERSADVIVALIAILKAGAAYVPFDPNYPQQRIAFMLEDTQVAVLVTDSTRARDLPPFRGAVVLLDQDRSVIDAEAVSNPVAEGIAESLAYVLYTSGSTGIPKGTCVPHRAVVRLVRESNFMTFDAADVYLQFASISFDASTLEIWGSLLNGARLVVYPPGTPSLGDLGAFVRQNSITTMWMTAGLFHLMVDHQLEDLQGVMQLLAGGDVLSPSHVQRAQAALPKCRLINGYGPTENTTFTCCYTISEGTRAGSIPIGRPISNTTVYVLDAHRRLVPIGVPGELYAGGAGLALGYLRRPELTAEYFVPNPFQHGSLLYRTGDLVRYKHDGNLEFLGRIDSQVKIRGFRVELGEIETVLKEFPLVEDAIVIVRKAKEDKQLIAYVVGRKGMVVDPNEIQRNLKTRLPDYMRPSVIMPLAALPLSPNGKVDRRSLPDPDLSNPIGTLTDTKRTEMELRIASVWNDVLSLHNVGVDNNFFDLGGNSLLLMQAHVRLQQEFGRQIPVVELFRSPTVASLAASLSKISDGDAGDGSEKLERARFRRASLSRRLETNSKRKLPNA